MVYFLDKSVRQPSWLKNLIFIDIQIQNMLADLTMKYLSWNTFIKAAAQHCNVLCKSGHILQCSFEDNFNVILCKRYTCMRTQQLIIHRMKASTTTTILYCLEYDEADSHEGRAMPAWMLVSIFIHCYTSSRNVMPLRLLSRTFLWRM